MQHSSSSFSSSFFNNEAGIDSVCWRIGFPRASSAGFCETMAGISAGDAVGDDDGAGGGGGAELSAS